ncbi:PPC domain [Sesbania bispinosa]|nr:PPC domain [Sesbania bispinosa]
MEDLNQNVTFTDSPSPTLNKPQTNYETPVQPNYGENNAALEGVGVENVVSGSVISGAQSQGSEPAVKRGRGRPRKYDVNGNRLSSSATPPPPPGFDIQPYAESVVKRGRGRPRGTGKLQILASMGGYVAETAGGSFIPHVLTVNTGEDVVNKIISFFQKGPRSVCILSATGPVSSVTIRQPGPIGGFLRYEGIFQILSLSGSCTYTGAGGALRKSGMLSVSLAKPDGRVFGGGIESSLIAAGPIQLVLGTFKQNITNKTKKRNSSSAAANMADNPDHLKQQQQTNGVADKVIPATTEVVPDYVNPDDNNVHSDSVSGVDLEYQILQPSPDQRTPADVDVIAP